MVALGGVHRLQHLLLGELELLGDLADGGGMAELGRHLGVRLLDLQDPLLDVPGDVHGPAAVAEVALQLAEDGGDGEGREGGPALRVEPVDRLDQGHARHLHQVVERLGTPRVAGGEPARQRHEALHQLLAYHRRAVPGESPQQRALPGQLLL